MDNSQSYDGVCGLELSVLLLAMQARMGSTRVKGVQGACAARVAHFPATSIPYCFVRSRGIGVRCRNFDGFVFCDIHAKVH